MQSNVPTNQRKRPSPGATRKLQPSRRAESPRQVPIAQVRSFFRHLGEAHQLAADIIAREYFAHRGRGKYIESDANGEATELRAIVLDIASKFRLSDVERVGYERAERRYLGIARGDLGREPAKQIAADLGISLRQLRRERNYARARIALALLENAGSVLAETLPDAVTLELDLARRLADSGRTAAAIQILQSLADAAIPLHRQLEVLMTMFEVFIDCELYDRAVVTIDAIQNRQADVSGDRQRPLAAVQELLRTGRVTRTEENIAATTWMDAQRDPRTAALASVVLIARVRRALARGEWTIAGAEMQKLRSSIVGPHASPMAKIDSLTLESHILMARSSELARARTVAANAVDIAQSNGLERRAAIATRHLAFAQFLMGDLGRAASTSQAALEVAQRAGDADVLASATLAVADIELRRGNMRAALPHLQSATAFVAEGSIYWSQLHLRWTDLFRQRGAPQIALQHSDIARRTAEQLGNERFLAAALRRCAELQYTLGNPTEAAKTIRLAIDLLRLHGTEHGLDLAYSISAQITGVRADPRPPLTSSR